MGKEKIPLEILDLLKFDKNPDLSLLIYKETEDLVFVCPKELDSKECFFRIVKKSNRQVNGTETFYDIFFKPNDRNNADAYNGSKNLEQIKTHFLKWISFVKEYLKTDTLIDDPIINSYKSEFDAKIKILDSDAEFAPFDLERQLGISNYLVRFDEAIEKYKTPENEKSFEDIQKDIEKLKGEITSQPKQKIVQKLTQLLARSRKLSLQLIKEVFVEIYKRNRLLRKQGF